MSRPGGFRSSHDSPLHGVATRSHTTNRPLFLGRDGAIKYDLAAIDHERRNGYAWYGYWGLKLSQPYARWLARQGRNAPEAVR